MPLKEKSSLPQGSYFPCSWKIPGNSGWSITGHSRALERTGFLIPELRVVLDAGVDVPTDAGSSRPAAILITHGHIDHMNALPMLLRHKNAGDPPVEIIAPAAIIHRLRQFTQLSWAIKVDEDSYLPPDYEGPSEVDREQVLTCISSDDTTWVHFSEQQDSHKSWRGVKAGCSMELSVGKKNSSPIMIHTVELFHGLCTSVGYILSIPSTERKCLKPHLQGATKKETAENVKRARVNGEEINTTITIPETPQLAFVLDTTVDALNESRSKTATQIIACPIIMIECTYLEDSKQEEAMKRGHIWWGGLLPYVKKCYNQQESQPTTWVLVHFSLRYSDQEIIEFFQKETQSHIRLDSNPAHSSRPPDIVLWLDSGPQEFWIQSFLT